MNACKHSYAGFCKACSELKPYVIFILRNGCKELNCKCCGYFYGGDHPTLAGKIVYEEKKD